MSNEQRANNEEYTNEARANLEELTNEQLVSRIQAGEAPADAMTQLYEQNRGFIHSIAWRYRAYEAIEDLEQEAVFGLYEAVSRFDAGMGYKFMTYAEKWIRQSIQRYIENNACCLRLPSYAQSRLLQYKRLCSAYQQELNRMPTDAEAAYSMGLSMEQMESVKKNSRRKDLRSLEEEVNGLEGEGITLGDSVADSFDVEGEVLGKVQQEQLKEELWNVVDGLEGRQPDVIRRRYQGGETLETIGQAYGVSRDAIRQTETKALRELRKPHRAARLRPFLPEAERVYSIAIAGNGAKRFSQTWTSSTERAAMLLLNT